MNAVTSFARLAQPKSGQLPEPSLLWLAVICAGFAIGMADIFHLARLDENGITILTAKPPTWDFTNLWYGGRLALDDRVDVLFDVEQYRAGLRDMFAPYVADSEWSYPPTLLLIAAPLALLPLYLSYSVWTFGTLGLLTLVLRRAGLPIAACGLLWLSPGALNNMLFGHNGALTAALLFGGLMAADKRPILAGLLLGLLTIKPQLGILVPVCLIAAGYWRTIFWSMVFAALWFGLSLILFSPDAWLGFLGTTQPMMQAILEAPYGQGYQANATTVFVSLRGFGLSLPAAYCVQAAVTLCAAFVAWRLWRRPTTAPLLRAAATAVLTLLATPYGYSYDLVALSAAVLIVRNAQGPGNDLILAPLWLWPVLVNLVNVNVAPLSPVILIGAAWVSTRALAERTHSTGIQIG